MCVCAVCLVRAVVCFGCLIVPFVCMLVCVVCVGCVLFVCD